MTHSHCDRSLSLSLSHSLSLLIIKANTKENLGGGKIPDKDCKAGYPSMTCTFQLQESKIPPSIGSAMFDDSTVGGQGPYDGNDILGISGQGVGMSITDGEIAHLVQRYYSFLYIPA